MKVTLPALPAASGSPPNGSFALLQLAAAAGAAREVEAAGALARHRLTPISPCVLRDDVALVVLRDREQPEHVLDLGGLHADGGRDRRVGLAAEVALADVAAHRGEPLQREPHRLVGRRR